MRNLMTVVFDKYLGDCTIYRVYARNRLIGYFVKPDEIFISINDPFVAEKLEYLNPSAREYLRRCLSMNSREDKFKKGISVSYFLRLMKLAGLTKVVVDGVEYTLPEWESVVVTPSYFYVPKCQKYASVEYRCPRCCGWLVKAFCEPLFGVPQERIDTLPDDVKKRMGSYSYRLPETGREGIVYFPTTHPCPFMDRRSMTCTQPLEVRPIKCYFYPSLVVRVDRKKLVLSRNINACRRKTKLKLAVKPEGEHKIVPAVNEKIKVDLRWEITAYRRLHQLTGSSKILLIIDAIAEAYEKI